MIIKLNDRSLVTSFVQIVLRDFSGLSIRSSDNSYEVSENSYEIVTSSPIKVTGVYDLDTYASASLFMILNYPREMFPVRYDVEEGKLVETPYDKEKLKETFSWMKEKFNETRRVNQEIYESWNPDLSKVFDWLTLIKYFNNEVVINDFLRTNAPFTEVFKYSVIVFITNNINLSTSERDAVNLTERVLSYFFGEVVTSISSPDEIYRIQKKIYDKIPKHLYGVFTKSLGEDIEKIQSDFISSHFVKNKEGEVIRLELPDGFEGFKVTGYVDPWTEMIIDERGVAVDY